VRRLGRLVLLLVSSHLPGCGEGPLDAVVLPPRDLTDALIAHWRFDEGSGAIVADSSGNGHDGQITTATWISDGRFAQALRLGAGDAVAIPSFPAATPNWSVSAWIRLSPEQMAANTEFWATILSTEILAAGGWEMNIDSHPPAPRFVFSYWSSPLMGYVVTGCECVETGRWIHLAAVVDAAANHVTLYRDGKVVAQRTRPSDFTPGDPTLYLGRWGAGGRILNGDLDDVAVWGRALAAIEVAALTAGPPGDAARGP